MTLTLEPRPALSTLAQELVALRGMNSPSTKERSQLERILTTTQEFRTVFRENLSRVRRLIEDVDNPFHRRELLTLLESNKESSTYLIHLLKDESAEIRHKTAVVLGELRPCTQAVILALSEAMQREQVPSIAAEALGKIGAAAVPALIKVVESPDDNIRLSAVQALGWIGAEAHEAVPVLLKRLRDPAPRISRDAGYALGKIGKAAVPALLIALKDPELSVRCNAILAIGIVKGFGAVAAVPALVWALCDSSWSVRGKAAEALSSIAKEMIPALARASIDASSSACQFAITAFRKIRGRGEC